MFPRPYRAMRDIAESMWFPTLIVAWALSETIRYPYYLGAPPCLPVCCVTALQKVSALCQLFVSVCSYNTEQEPTNLGVASVLCFHRALSYVRCVKVGVVPPSPRASFTLFVLCLLFSVDLQQK